MHFALVAYDRPGHLERRLEIRPEHVKYLEALGDTLKFAGPFLNDKGESVGSLMIIEAESLEAARAAYARDPYAQAGLFDSVTIKPWKPFINKMR